MVFEKCFATVSHNHIPASLIAKSRIKQNGVGIPVHKVIAGTSNDNVIAIANANIVVTAVERILVRRRNRNQLLSVVILTPFHDAGITKNHVVAAVGSDGITHGAPHDIITRVGGRDGVDTTKVMIRGADLDQSSEFIELGVSVIAHDDITAVVRSTIDRVIGHATKNGVRSIGGVDQVISTMFRRGGPNLTHDAGQVLRIEIEDRFPTVPDDGIGTRITFDLQALAGVVDEVVVGTADNNVVTTAHDDFVASARRGCGAFDGLNDFVLVIEEEDFSAIAQHDIPTVVGSGIDVISTGTPDHDVEASIGPDLVGSALGIVD